MRELIPADKEWVTHLLTQAWGSPQIATRERLLQADELPGVVAIYGGHPAGLATYQVGDAGFEIVTMNSLFEGQGVGRQVVDKLKWLATVHNCDRIWLVTSNDNLKAMRFWEHQGFTKFKVHLNSIEGLRKLKPEIPLIGLNGIKITDEIEYELILDKLE
ncbi:GNAT family N-acetyltransferase [Calditrichota bacterium]